MVEETRREQVRENRGIPSPAKAFTGFKSTFLKLRYEQLKTFQVAFPKAVSFHEEFAG